MQQCFTSEYGEISKKLEHVSNYRTSRKAGFVIRQMIARFGELCRLVTDWKNNDAGCRCC
ncbi:hypothetical protein T10_2585 [Trichinella papuae]|uniref:Uncharacterized protein n=1 Tax=Trichinella papuae TaxID=268474 RepID=A0A0V1NA17_9BILA|nr:hypothetical protein T10_2585 [Trichinella papuae]